MAKQIIKGLLALFVFLPARNTMAQQDPQFTQYMFNMLAINPAYAGSAERVSIKALSRHQWTGLEGAPTTQTITMHTPVWHESIALGGTIMRDEHGPVSQYGMFVDAAYRIFFNHTKLAFGLKGGATYFQGLFSELNPLESNDVVFQQDVTGKIDPQFGFGMMLYGDRFYVGASVPRLLNTDFFDVDSLATLSEPGQREHLFLSAGVVFDLNNYIKFKPTFLLKAVDGAPLSIDLTAHFLFYEKFWLGGMYRHEDAVGAIAQYQFTDALSAGYSYDFPISELQPYTGGSHEIMIGYEFGNKLSGIRSPRYF